MLRRGKELRGLAGLDQHALLHDANALGKGTHQIQVMGDQHDCHAELGLEVAQQVENLRTDGDIERGGRFVRQQQLRAAGQRHSNHRALALPPESWCGKLSKRCAASLMPVRSSSAIARSRAARRSSPSCSASVSTIWLPIV